MNTTAMVLPQPPQTSAQRLETPRNSDSPLKYDGSVQRKEKGDRPPTVRFFFFSVETAISSSCASLSWRRNGLMPCTLEPGSRDAEGLRLPFDLPIDANSVHYPHYQGQYSPACGG